VKTSENGSKPRNKIVGKGNRLKSPIPIRKKKKKGTNKGKNTEYEEVGIVKGIAETKGEDH